MSQQKNVSKKILQSLLFVPMIFAFAFSVNTQSQANTSVPISTDSIRKARPNLDKPDKNGIYQVVDKMPGYPGGEKALLAFIGANLHYPVIAQENGIQGTVIVRFVVTNNGSVDKIEVVRSLDPACDKEAVRVLSSMASWTPGEQNGKKVSVYYTLPIKYKLTGTDTRAHKSPVIVLDGVILPKTYNPNSINKDNIEKVDVIKPDTKEKMNELIQKYGDNAANGVVLITSKKKLNIQTSDSVKKNISSVGEPTFQVIEQMPEYPGGIGKLLSFIGSNLKYPVSAQQAKIQGTVILRFVVNKTGKVERSEILRSLSPECDREALRVVNLMPNWTPGKQKGENVSVWYTLPIKFKLD